ncbi:hypothetical protein C4D60_Mb10t26330 [Musa balbisiana]|uniref:Uncharacterized protein n=1 Tax=Musa balbisiana TaxID=52838 RepID=A0A4S8J017_MUSBA|nr:hypothetical protein C4D60_Mb10t26330 [Musa balbisiana]
MLSDRYVALNMLMKAVTIESQAVQRHRTTILERVKVSDLCRSMVRPRQRRKKERGGRKKRRCLRKRRKKVDEKGRSGRKKRQWWRNRRKEEDKAVKEDKEDAFAFLMI